MDRYFTVKRYGKDEEFWEVLLLMNAVPGILPMEIRRIDGEESYFFDRQEKRSLVQLVEHEMLKGEGIRKILSSLDRVMNCLEEYLLSRNGIDLNPERIVQNGAGDWEFCYIGKESVEVITEYEDFAAFLSEHVDHNDDEAVALSYGYEQLVFRGKVCPDELLTREQEQLGAMFEIDSFTEVSFSEFPAPVSDKGLYFGEKESEEITADRSLIKTLALCIGLILIATAGYLAAFLNPGILEMFGISRQHYIAAGAALMAAVTLMILGVIRNYTVKKEGEKDGGKSTSRTEYFTELSEPPFR